MASSSIIEYSAHSNTRASDSLSHVVGVDEAGMVEEVPPIAREVSGLGPMEDVDREVFDIIKKNEMVNSKMVMREVAKCKFCHEEFPYPLRDKMIKHKNHCKHLPESQDKEDDAESIRSLSEVLEQTGEPETPSGDDEDVDFGLDQEDTEMVDDETELDPRDQEEDNQAHPEKTEVQASPQHSEKSVSPTHEEGEISDAEVDSHGKDTRSISDHDDAQGSNNVSSSEHGSSPRNSSIGEPPSEEHTDEVEQPTPESDKREPSSPRITPKQNKAVKRKIPTDGSATKETENRAAHRQSLSKEDESSPMLRRSKRLKSDVNQSHSLQKEGGILGQFITVDKSPKIKRLLCMYCGYEIIPRSDLAAKHLVDCKKFLSQLESRQELTDMLYQMASTAKESEAMVIQALGDAVVDISTGAAPNGLPAAVATYLTTCKRERAPFVLNSTIALTWLLGSKDNVEHLKQHYHRSFASINAPPDRLQGLMKDGLCDLDLYQLLTCMPPNGKMRAFAPSISGEGHCTIPFQVATSKEVMTLHNAGYTVSIQPPDPVMKVVVPPLATALGLGPFVTTESHKLGLMYGGAGGSIEWQFHRSDFFVICLSGNPVWKMKRAVVKQPLQCFCPTKDHMESSIKMQFGAAPGVSTKMLITPPTKEAGIMEAGESDTETNDGFVTVKSEAGSVLYMPSGTWYRIENLDHAVWLQVQIHTVTYADVMVDTVRQLMWSESSWREPILAPTEGIKSIQNRMTDVLGDLSHKLQELKAVDVVPELVLLANDMQHEVTYDQESGYVGKSFEFDLTQPNVFKGGRYIKLFQGSMFRVNPLAVLLCSSEIPGAETRQPATATSSTAGPSAVAKKTHKGKQKRQSNAGNTRGHAKNEYLLHVAFGNPTFCSRLRVKFSCDAVQKKMVDWIRHRTTPAAFHVHELAKIAGINQTHGGGNEESTLKFVLRFLCAVGYLTQVKVPL